MCVRWYAAYPLSLRQLEEMMAERGVFVDHATVHRWALKMLPVLAKVLRHRKHPVGPSWRGDETYVKVAGQLKYLYRAIDKLGQTVDFLLTARRDEAAARRLFERAIDLHDAPEKITIDKSGANTAAVQGLIADSGLAIGLRQSKYLNNLIEQDHRAVKWRGPPMLGFKTFRSAQDHRIETMHDQLIATEPGSPVFVLAADRRCRFTLINPRDKVPVSYDVSFRPTNPHALPLGYGDSRDPKRRAAGDTRLEDIFRKLNGGRETKAVLINLSMIYERVRSTIWDRVRSRFSYRSFATRSQLILFDHNSVSEFLQTV